ncbi:MAG: hypothetical protein Q7S21_00360 [archaeon]|nr:hypothetical protein [archaeon]
MGGKKMKLIKLLFLLTFCLLIFSLTNTIAFSIINRPAKTTVDQNESFEFLISVAGADDINMSYSPILFYSHGGLIVGDAVVFTCGPTIEHYQFTPTKIFIFRLPIFAFQKINIIPGELPEYSFYPINQGDCQKNRNAVDEKVIRIQGKVTTIPGDYQIVTTLQYQDKNGIFKTTKDTTIIHVKSFEERYGFWIQTFLGVGAIILTGAIGFKSLKQFMKTK